MEKIDQKTAIKGGEFLIRETEAHEIFIPEKWTEEQKMIAQTCRDFLATEVYPKLDEIDSMKNPGELLLFFLWLHVLVVELFKVNQI